MTIYFDLQWKPLNVISLGKIETDKINQMITITHLVVSYTECQSSKLNVKNNECFIQFTNLQILLNFSFAHISNIL
jgi:hypothetical protein